MRKFRHRSETADTEAARKPRAAGYVRVSTEEQAQHGYSIEAQKEKLETACRFQEFELVEIYVDDGYSGKDLNRPAVQRLIADAKAKKFDIILVYKLDRFSRRLGDLIPLGERLESIGISIRSITEPWPPQHHTDHGQGGPFDSTAGQVVEKFGLEYLDEPRLLWLLQRRRRVDQERSRAGRQ